MTTTEVIYNKVFEDSLNETFKMVQLSDEVRELTKKVTEQKDAVSKQYDKICSLNTDFEFSYTKNEIYQANQRILKQAESYQLMAIRKKNNHLKRQKIKLELEIVELEEAKRDFDRLTKIIRVLKNVHDELLTGKRKGSTITIL